MSARIRVTDPDKLALLYERFRDVCLVEKEVWKEIFMPRDVSQGPVRTNIQDRYEVEIDDSAIEDALDANILRGTAALGAAIRQALEPDRRPRLLAEAAANVKRFTASRQLEMLQNSYLELAAAAAGSPK